MRYKTFGRRTGLRVSEVALGGGNFGTGWGYGAEPDESRRIFDAYVAVGGNFIDTSDNYQFGQSEQLIGEFIRADRDQFVIASKYTQDSAKDPTVLTTGNSRKNMIRSIEASLKRLNTDRLDLYWAHMTDGMTPLDEILRAFDDLVRSGKILHAGLSNFPAWRIARSALLADMKNWAPLVGVQIEYSLVERTAEREILPMAEALGLGVAAWSPLGGGLLTGKYRINAEGRATTLGMLVHTESSQRETDILDCLIRTANELGAKPAHVAIAWLRSSAARSTTALVPILGPKTKDQFVDVMNGLEITLSDEQVLALEMASKVALGVPHEMVTSERYRTKLAGGTADTFDYPILPPV